MRNAARHLAVTFVALCAIVFGALLATAAPARAITVVYGEVDCGIYTLNTTTGAAAALYTGTPFASPCSKTSKVQAGGQRPSDGLLFFLYGNGTNQQVYSYNPFTPGVAPVLLGNTGTGVTIIPRLAFDKSGTLWAVDGTGNIYTIAQSSCGTTCATSTGNKVTGVSGGGGDFAIRYDGSWYFASGKNFYTVPSSAGGAATLVGTTGSANSITGLAFGPGGVLYGVDSSSPSNLYSINTSTGAGTLVGAVGTPSANFGDLASVIAPDVQVTKVAVSSPFNVGSNGQYTITASDLPGSAPTTSGITVTDTLPTGLTYVSASGTGWTCNFASGKLTCSNPSTILPGAADPAITLTVAVGSAAAPSVSNTASATGGGAPSYYASDATSTAVTPVVNASAPNLSIKKTAVSSPFLVNQQGKYTLTVSNAAGGKTTSGTITVTDTLPAGLSYVSATGTNWTCAYTSPTITCTYTGTIKANKSAPNITVTVNVLPAAGTSVTNTATVSGGGSNSSSGSATTPVNPPSLSIVKAAVSAPFIVGRHGQYRLTVSNATGAAPSFGTVTVTDTLPAGLTYISATGTGWSCGVSSATVTCTRTAVIAAGASAPVITLTVDVGGAATPSAKNTGTVSGGGSTNGTSTITTTVNQPAASSGDLVTGPIDMNDTATDGGQSPSGTTVNYYGAEYTGSFDGSVTASNNYDFTARPIPFPAGTVLVNNGTTRGTPAGGAITAARVTVNVPNMVYYDNLNTGDLMTFTPTVPGPGWSAVVCPDNGVGTAGSGTGGNGPMSPCTTAQIANLPSPPGPAGDTNCIADSNNNGGGSTAGWVTAGATATYCADANGDPVNNVVYWVVYTTPASGLVAFTRYDAYVTVADSGQFGTQTSNITHNELYAGYIPLTKSTAVTSTGCPVGAKPTYVSGVCPGGVMTYTIDYRNIMAGAGLGTEGQLSTAFLLTTPGTFVLGDDGINGGNTWGTNGTLWSTLASGGTYASCGAGANPCGDSIAGATFRYYTGTAVDTNCATGGSTSFTAKANTGLCEVVGGSTFQLVPSGLTAIAGGKSQGTLIFAITIK